ncbi:unnamed protein product [Lactuca virosa]|uniref:Protein kinase domain-containing protein n=1 Tax=Lactuca virosa TaxID=75947 RepID=A0AAU9N4F5_9ASTR|nr:unnamed protein product [Lactuca virosa]
MIFGKQRWASHDRQNSMCATLEFMSPEIVQGRGHDKTADWWSVGILIYEMLTRKPPFRVVTEGFKQATWEWSREIKPSFVPQVAGKQCTVNLKSVGQICPCFWIPLLRVPNVIRMIGESAEVVGRSSGNKMPTLEEYASDLTIHQVVDFWLQNTSSISHNCDRLRHLGILHDAVPHHVDRVGHPMHVKVLLMSIVSSKVA